MARSIGDHLGGSLSSFRRKATSRSCWIFLSLVLFHVDRSTLPLVLVKNLGKGKSIPSLMVCPGFLYPSGRSIGEEQPAFNFNLMCLWHVSLLEVELVFTYDPGAGDVTLMSVPG